MRKMVSMVDRRCSVTEATVNETEQILLTALFLTLLPYASAHTHKHTPLCGHQLSSGPMKCLSSW